MMAALYSQLTWVWSQGTSTLRVDFTDGWKDVVVTTLQAVLVLWFNMKPVMTVNELAMLSGMDKNNLKRVVAPMVRVLFYSIPFPLVPSRCELRPSPPCSNALLSASPDCVAVLR